MTELLDYHGYGNSRLTSGTATAKKTFIGQYTDSETSLSYLNARYYDSARGQFLSEDSVFLGMGTDGKALTLLLADPQSQNSYSYARDNPIGSSDPGGKSWWTGVQGFAAHAAVALAVGVVFGAAATAVVATLPFSVTALTVMAVAGGLGVVASTANSVMTTNRAYSSGLISTDQRDAQWGGALGDVMGGVVGGGIEGKIGSGLVGRGASHTASNIADHAWMKHVENYGEFGGKSGLFQNKQQFANYIDGVMKNPSEVRQIANGRTAYWDNKNQAIIIHDPNSAHSGSCFQPKEGKSYFEKPNL